MERNEQLEKLTFQLLQEIGEDPEREGLKRTPSWVYTRLTNNWTIEDTKNN